MAFSRRPIITARKSTGGIVPKRLRVSTPDSSSESDEELKVAPTISKMDKMGSVSSTWSFENWNKCHRLLAAKAECIFEIQDVVLRFFLRPVEKRVKVKGGDDQKVLINEWYSLLVELISGQQEACVGVKSSNTEFTRLNKSGGVQVFLKRTLDNPRGTSVVVEEFLLFEKWLVNGENGRYETDERSDDDLDVDVEEEELEIPLKVTLFKFGQTLSNGQVAAYDSLGATLGETRGNRTLKSDVSAIFEETEGKLFSDAFLHMKDGVTLHAHRLILTGSSPVFKAMFTTDMKEATSGDVSIPDISSNVMKIILAHIYTGSVSSFSTQLTQNISEVVYAASKYQLDDLVAYLDRLVITLVSPENAMDLLKTAKTHQLPTATENLRAYVKIHSAEILMSQVDSD